MNPSNNNWIGQVTTGHGFMVLAPTLVAAFSGTMSWHTALPLIVAGIVGLIWPENAGLKTTAQTAATDLMDVYAQYQTDTVTVASNAPVPPGPGKTAAGLAILAAIGLSLSACTGQTPTQQAAEVRAVECIADTVAKVAAAPNAPGGTVAQVASAATVVGNQLATDAACAPVVTNPPAPAKP